MKTSKRDPAERAYKQGYNEGLKHHSDNNCPENAKKRAIWLAGFREGRRSRIEGVMRSAIVH